MKKIPIKSVLAAACLALGTLSLSCNGHKDSCANKVIKEVASPDKSLRALIFERACGVTVPSTQISVLKADADLSNEAGDVFISTAPYNERETPDGKRPNVEAKWLDDKKLVISFDDDGATKFLKMKQEAAGDVKIIYDKRRTGNNNQNANQNDNRN